MKNKVNHSHKSDTLNYPVRAWSIWLLSACFMFYKYAIEVSPSVMTGTLMSAFDISGAALGNLAATYFYAYLILQVPAGLLLDRFGPRKVSTFAIILCAVGSLVFGSATTVFEASLGRFLTGAGAAFAVVNCLKLIANWFPYRQFAFMAGLMMTMAMFGAVGGQAPLAQLVEILGWRESMAAIGQAGLVLSVLFWVVVRDKAPDHVRDKRITNPKIPLFESLKHVLKSEQSWWLSLYSALAFAPVMVFGGLWGVSFLKEAFLLDKNMAAQMVSLIFIGFAIGAPVFGWYSDWLGERKKVMFIGTLIALVAISTVVYLPGISTYSLSFFLFLFGFSISSFLLCFTMIREINLPLMAATAIGFMNAFDALLGAISDPLTGFILDSLWQGEVLDGARVFSLESYRVAFAALPLYLFLAWLTLFKVEETHCKPVYPTSLP